MSKLYETLQSTLPPLLSGIEDHRYLDQDSKVVRDLCIELFKSLDLIDVQAAKIIELSADKDDAADCINYLREHLNQAVSLLPRRGTLVEVMKESEKT